jgi:RNA polymerase sigma-70 factor (ECF subfamily)
MPLKIRIKKNERIRGCDGSIQMHNPITVETIPIALETDESKDVMWNKFSTANFTLLYRQYVTRVYRYIYSRVGNQADAEDLTSQVFVAALEGIEKFDGRGSFPAWLFTIARNKIVDSYRKSRPIVSLDGIPERIAEDVDPLNRLSQEAQIHELAQILAALSDEQRTLLQLRFAAELTHAQIAEVLGKSEGAVKMTFSRLLRQLEEKLEHSDE